MNEFKFKDEELATLQAILGYEVWRLKKVIAQHPSLDNETNNKAMKKASDLWIYLTEGKRKQ